MSRQTLKSFWDLHDQAEAPLRSWSALAKAAEWHGPADLKAQFRSVDFIGDNRVIFNIGGNRFRLIVQMAYRYKRILVKSVGTHADYDRINPETVV